MASAGMYEEAAELLRQTDKASFPPICCRTITMPVINFTQN